MIRRLRSNSRSCNRVVVLLSMLLLPLISLAQVPVTTVKDIPRIIGKVINQTNEPMEGVTVREKGNRENQTKTNRQGEFMLALSTTSGELEISFLGYQPQTVRVDGTTKLPLIVVLEQTSEAVDEIIVTGYSRRTKDSFTGSASTFTQKDLQQVGNKNLLQSLQNLDPSFVISEDMVLGSNPNALPDIQLRGQSGLDDIRGEYVGNPNQPLFILDGFEASLQKVYDLDMNRVASVTILRDAAAKAIYGSKAANGVVVIETIVPQAGALRISYNGNFNVEAPDLTSYNLATAAEKLEVERNAGRYTSGQPFPQQFLNEQYNDLLANVARGVDTYWLSKPLRVGIGQKHGIYLEGGNEAMRYGVDVSYNNLVGVMKGSNRDNIGGSVNLSYRSNNLIFRNVLSINFNKSVNSPYGAFSEYSRLNPYWAPEDEFGNVTKVLGVFRTSPSASPQYYYNPLYNATLNTKDFSTYAEITENFYTEWNVSRALRLTGRVGFTHNTNSAENFLPGDHTRFTEWTGDSYFNRGSYSITDGKSTSVSTDVFANWTRQWGPHLLLVNGGGNLAASQAQSHGMTAWGFLNNRVDFISFARQYEENGVPRGTESIQREVGLIGFGSYSYDNRYLADLSVRRNASSVFGSDNRWGTFWSLGLGWNLHHEAFLKQLGTFDLLKLRASYGSTGSQNFNPFQAMATYSFFTSSTYDNISGAYLYALANDNLSWQETRDFNVGVDVSVLNRLNLRFDYYLSNTDNLLIDFTLPPSTGFNTYKENLGAIQNRGYEGTVNLQLYRDASTQSYVSLFGSFAHNTNKITEIAEALRQSNNEQDTQTDNLRAPLTRYEEGQSISSIWAVPSLGIDPITGREMYRSKDGHTTYTWDPNDQIVAGITDPALRGTFGVNLEYRGWGLSTTFRYMLDADYYNSTLVNRVENVNIAYNVDTRVLNATWLNPGDQTAFKRITAAPTTTRPTTRFVEKKSDLHLASVNAYYDFKWKNLKRYGINNLKCSFYMNDVFVLSTVRTERGTDYPFARTFSFALQTTF